MTNKKDIGKEFSDFSYDIFRTWGLDSLSAKLYSILYVEPTEMSIEEIAHISGYSLSSVSNKMRFLEGVFLVKRIKKPTSKKVYYFAPKSLLDVMEKKMERMKQIEVLPVKKLMPDLLVKYGKMKMSRKDTEKLKIIKNYYKQILIHEEMVNHMLKFIQKKKGA